MVTFALPHTALVIFFTFSLTGFRLSSLRMHTSSLGSMIALLLAQLFSRVFFFILLLLVLFDECFSIHFTIVSIHSCTLHRVTRRFSYFFRILFVTSASARTRAHGVFIVPSRLRIFTFFLELSLVRVLFSSTSVCLCVYLRVYNLSLSHIYCYLFVGFGCTRSKSYEVGGFCLLMHQIQERFGNVNLWFRSFFHPPQPAKCNGMCTFCICFEAKLMCNP